jgi:hypothetical protein
MAKSRKQADDAPEIGKLIRQSIYRRFGLRGLVALAIAGLALTIWMRWNDVRTLPGLSRLVAYVSEEPVPRADLQSLLGPGRASRVRSGRPEPSHHHRSDEADFPPYRCSY